MLNSSSWSQRAKAEIVAPQPSAAADADRVRCKLDTVLEEARNGAIPQSQRRLIETVVPQMVRWLPEDEAERVKQAFGRRCRPSLITS